MPTYTFYCKKCYLEWQERQSINAEHVSACRECREICLNTSFGGNGFRFSGKHMNQRLKGFPDNSKKINAEGDALAKEYEQADTYMHKDIDKTTREAAAKSSQKKREKRSERFRKNP